MPIMKEGPDIAGLAALIGDPARANMLSALMEGKALTAGELAGEAGVTPQTASGHLARLETPDVLAARTGRVRTRTGPRDEAMREARRCYDHLAGTLGVALFDALVRNGDIVQGVDGLAPSTAGRARFVAEGIDMNEIEARRRPVCRACLDWSERRPHLAGSLGAALMSHFIKRGWAKADAKSRAIVFTPAGRAAFDAFLRPQAKQRAALRG